LLIMTALLDNKGVPDDSPRLSLSKLNLSEGSIIFKTIQINA